eukprot:g12420.t1
MTQPGPQAKDTSPLPEGLPKPIQGDLSIKRPSPAARPDTHTALQDAIARYHRPLVVYALSQTGNLQRAQDAAQDTLLTLCQQPSEQLEQDILPRLAPWLFTVCRNRVIDLHRKESRMAASPGTHAIVQDAAKSSEVSPADQAEAQDQKDHLLSLVASLPSHQREVVQLRFQGSLAYKEIADVTGHSIANPTMNDHTNPPMPEDALLTAYALGELDPQSEAHHAVEARLASDAVARAYVQQTRALADQLMTSYQANDHATGLTEQQQQVVSAAIAAPPTDPIGTKSNSPHVLRMPRKLLLAAGLALAATAAITTVTLMNGPDNTEQLATEITGFAQVQEALATKRVAVDFDNATLNEVFAFLHKQTGVSIDADWEALRTRGITPKTRVTMTDDALFPAGEVLAHALQLAWLQSPHPDPAQWSINNAGVRIAPQSALVQARLDATAKLLEQRQFSRAKIVAELLGVGTADVWDTDVWNQMLAKRTEVGQRVLAEADASLDLAEQAVTSHTYDDAEAHALYTYRLLAGHRTALQSKQFETPLDRIGKLQEAIFTGRLEQDKAAIAKAVADAKANDTELSAYDGALAAAAEALDSRSYLPATEAVTAAAMHLENNKDQYGPAELSQLASRANRLHIAILRAQQALNLQAAVAARASYEQALADALPAATIDESRQQLVAAHLRTARALQLEQRYDESLAQLDAALLLDPQDAVIKALRDMIQDTRFALKSSNLKRQRDLEIASQNLMDIEASTPYADIVAYPNDWPELTAMRLRNLDPQRGRSLGLAGTDVYANGQFRYESRQQLAQQQDVFFGIPDLDARKTPDTTYVWGRKSQPPILSKQVVPQLGDMPMLGRAFRSDSLAFTDGHQSQLGQQVMRKGLIRSDQLAASPLQTLNTEYDGNGYMSEARYSTTWQFDGAAPSQRFVTDYGLAKGRGEITEFYKYGSYDRPTTTAIDPSGLDPQLSALPTTPGQQSRKQRYDDAIAGYILTPEDDQEPNQAKLQQIEALQAGLDRVRTIEPFENDRIRAVEELQELQQRFHEGSLQALAFDQQMARDTYAMVNDNPFKDPSQPGQAISTFSVDVDTAAYALVRRQLVQEQQLPVPGAIRIEELINYFTYDYDTPLVDGRALEDGLVTQASLDRFEQDNEGFAPFATHVQVADCPWATGNQLVRVGIQGMHVNELDRPAAHITFLLDVSGSMSSPNKLPLVKDSVKMMLDKLNGQDRISIIVYAGRTATVLENVSAQDRPRIERALDELKSGGSTAGAAGIQLAYDAAQKHFIDGGVNRVILCTDGDFNVGISDKDQLVELIKQKANPSKDADGKQRGVYLSVLGYGMGNLNDEMMEPLTNAGNGTYAYIDSHDEAQKVMYDQAGSTLVTIAKDVKVQVHFDPEQVLAYRLIGYENRILATKDFDDDTVDAGDIGAGHSVTALYEVVPSMDRGPALDEEGFREVRLRAEELKHAIAMNHSLMQTCSLNEGQTLKLIATSRLLEQELVFCRSAIETHDSPDAKARANGEPRLSEAPALVSEAEATNEADDRPEVELDDFADGAMMSLRLRYKPVDAPAEQGTSRRVDHRVFAEDAVPFAQADESMRFAAAVAGFGMVLRSSPHAGDADLGWVLDTAKDAAAHDPDLRRAEFIDLVGQAMKLMPADPLDQAPAAAE